MTGCVLALCIALAMGTLDASAGGMQARHSVVGSDDTEKGRSDPTSRAIIIAVNDMDAITKVLYPQVAKTFQTTPSRVECTIRHAIEVAWDREAPDTLQRFFQSYTVCFQHPRLPPIPGLLS